MSTAAPVARPVVLQECPRRVWICVNGIHNNPGDAEGWTDRAVTWLNLHTTGKAEKFEYAAGALTRRLRQQWRAEAIARMAGFYVAGGFELALLGHSNGADLIERVLLLLWPVHVRRVFLFAPACEGEVLARRLADGHLGALHLYGSTQDRALQLARTSKLLFGWAGLGYGDLGLRIEEFAAAHPGAYAHPDEAQGHSSWFARGERFERTMRVLLEHDTAGSLPPLSSP